MYLFVIINRRNFILKTTLMYKIFVNENPLFLTNQVSKETDFQVFLLDTVDIENLVIKMYQNKLQKVYLYDKDEKEMLKKFKSKFVVAKAGGGLVFNKNGDILFIMRNGKWDLPKGGNEKNEYIEETAMREVEEETGVSKLTITKKLQKTYHIFKRSGEYRLKITHWFVMTSDYEGIPVGQIEEGIEKAVWLNPDQVQEALKNSYQNIKLLFENLNDK
jgi:8-oxo-dGTP pyrophosphatase MutT (NUDIX family)